MQNENHLLTYLFSEYFLQFKAPLDQFEGFGKAMLNCSFYSRQSLGLFMYNT